MSMLQQTITLGFIMWLSWPFAVMAGPSRSVALVIGHNGSLDPETPPLRYADDDAIQYAHLFEELGIGVTLLVEPDRATRELYPNLEPDGVPSRTSITRAISAINRSSHASTVYLVYAGHGDVRHGEGFITLADGPLNRTDFFTQVLDPIKANTKHVVIDACKSYFLVFDRGAGGDRLPYDKPFDHSKELSNRPDTGFLLSASSSQNSHEWEAFQAGVFSHEVRSGLRGAADVDQDGHVKYGELAAFVQIANSSIPNEKYRPRFLAIPPVGSDTFVQLGSSSSGRLVFDTKQSHHFFVEDPDGIRVADLRPGQDLLRLRLPEGRDLYVHDVDDDVEYRM